MTKERIIATNEVTKAVKGNFGKVMKEVNKTNANEGVIEKFKIAFKKMGNHILLM